MDSKLFEIETKIFSRKMRESVRNKINEFARVNKVKLNLIICIFKALSQNKYFINPQKL